MQGLIFSVKRYSIHDGPGIRVTFFMKGCPLSCWWCHNPEGIACEQLEVEQTDRIGEKEFSRKEVVGKYYTKEDILAILEKEKIFLDKSNGGVTFSGGEPMLQFEFLQGSLMACKERGYHTAVDTSGFSSSDKFKKLIPFTNLFLFDIKHLDDQKHKMYTGVSNKLVLKNLNLIAESNSDFFVRIPVVPGFNDDEDYLSKLKKFLSELNKKNLKMINLLPYHKIGSSKYIRFEMPYKMENVEQPSTQRMNEIKDYFSDLGVKIKIGG
jgi:pyruvate formate lyase activating enzyme